MGNWVEKYRSFFFRMVNFVVLLTIVIFIFGTAITGKFWLPDLLENLIYVSFCTLFTSILVRGFYDRIYRFRRFLFFIVFALLSSLGVGLGLTIGTLILYGRLIYGINFLLATIIGILASAGYTIYDGIYHIDCVIDSSLAVWISSNYRKMRAKRFARYRKEEKITKFDKLI